MKTNKDYVLRKIADETMLVPTGQAAQQLNGMIRLTSTASFIFSEVDKCNSLNEIIIKLINEYDVDEKTAKNDVYGFLYQLYIRGIVLDIKEFEDIHEEK